MYFVGALKPFEWEQEFSPAWRFVGTKVRWSKGMMGIATAYVRRAFALVEGEEIPPFIAVHVRRADFANLCTPGTPLSECLPPISAYARRVKQVQDEVLLRKGIIIPDDRVIVTSDERDRTWWEREVNQRGWKWFDHEAEGTVEKLGKWYPALIDAVVQSMGVGFVGTARSTMSLVARRRVEDWNGGVTREVKWGSTDADDN